MFFSIDVYAADCSGSPVYGKDSSGKCCLQKYINDNGSCTIKDLSVDSNSKQKVCSKNEQTTVFYYPSVNYSNLVANQYFNDGNAIINSGGCTFYKTEKVEISYPKQNLIQAGMGLKLTVTIKTTKSYFTPTASCATTLSNYVKTQTINTNPKITIDTETANLQITSVNDVSYSLISSKTEYKTTGNQYEVISTNVYDVPSYTLTTGTGTVVKNNAENAVHALYTKLSLNTKVYDLNLKISNFSEFVSTRYLAVDCDYRIMSEYYETNNSGVVNIENINYYARPVLLSNLFPKNGIPANWINYNTLIDEIQNKGNSIYNTVPQYKMPLSASTINSIRNYNDRNSYTEFKTGFVKQFYNL